MYTVLKKSRTWIVLDGKGNEVYRGRQRPAQKFFDPKPAKKRKPRSKSTDSGV